MKLEQHLSNIVNTTLLETASHFKRLQKYAQMFSWKMHVEGGNKI